MNLIEEFYKHCSREVPIYKKGVNGKYKCPCCGYFTLDSTGDYDICPVCFWEDDGTDGNHSFSPNQDSLEGARTNFAVFGAVEERLAPYVRKPLPEEQESAK